MEYSFNDQNFDQEVLKSEMPVMVDFFAEWCGPCKMLAPIVEELSTEVDGKVKIGKMNVDEAPQTSQKYGVLSIPTILFIKKGEVVDKIVGYKGKEDLKKKLEELL